MTNKYGEHEIIAELKAYIDGTYGEHYIGENNIQALDVWKSLGTLETSSRDTAIKYLMRYGKKDGKNRKDLLKAMHYIILMLTQNPKEKNIEKHRNTKA